jgi:RND superfamily putative drug exporter
MARLGAWSATHLRAVLVLWLIVLTVFGAFAPQVEHALAGAGWQDSTSQSVKARAMIQKDFSGLGATALQVVIVDHHGPIATDPAAQSVLTKVSALLHANRSVSAVVAPKAGVSLSADGTTGVVSAGASGDANTMVRAADALAAPLGRLSRPGISVTLTGDSALWANFNSANRSAMLRSEMLSWPVKIIETALSFDQSPFSETRPPGFHVSRGSSSGSGHLGVVEVHAHPRGCTGHGAAGLAEFPRDFRR